jgi:hypothetical protein
MIFFRVHTVSLSYQRGEESFLLFGRLKATYAASVNELSGMTVNLKDVDQWMSNAKKTVSSFRHLDEALKSYYSLLSGSSKAFKKVEISVKNISHEYNGSEFTRTYHVKTWFQQGQTWVERPTSLKVKRLLSKSWRRRLAKKKWSSSERFASKLKSFMPELSSLEIENPELKITEKFQF